MWSWDQVTTEEDVCAMFAELFPDAFGRVCRSSTSELVLSGSWSPNLLVQQATTFLSLT